MSATQGTATVYSNLSGESATRSVERIRDHRRVEVGRMLLARTPIRTIAARLHVSTNTVCNDIKVVERWWHDTAIKDRGKLVERECKLLDELERAWLERALWDGAALDGVLRIMAQRAKLLGLNAPSQTELALTGSAEDLRQRALEIVADELERRRELNARANGQAIDVQSTEQTA
jgi:hypothetical protein